MRLLAGQASLAAGGRLARSGGKPPQPAEPRVLAAGVPEDSLVVTDQ